MPDGMMPEPVALRESVYEDEMIFHFEANCNKLCNIDAVRNCTELDWSIILRENSVAFLKEKILINLAKLKMTGTQWTLLIITALTVFSLPTEQRSVETQNISPPLRKSDHCYTLDGDSIKVGDSKPLEGCQKNCTCYKYGKDAVLECVPWCKLHRIVCELGATFQKVDHFEEVGKTGCKRCVSTECDAFSEYSRKANRIYRRRFTRISEGNFECW
eukprot:Seg701.2 transcript_id=Seg701.2/GoldUCD/mRNA.D3Y31 product="hypothetical protein" protein_id=Seg701.2/GoldUCD/D3Y31